jgi:hypothetical protein
MVVHQEYQLLFARHHPFRFSSVDGIATMISPVETVSVSMNGDLLEMSRHRQ